MYIYCFNVSCKLFKKRRNIKKRIYQVKLLTMLAFSIYMMKYEVLRYDNIIFNLIEKQFKNFYKNI